MEEKIMVINIESSIQTYINAQDSQYREQLQSVYQALANALPTATQKISWGMPTFWQGKNIIHFAPSKKHLGIYPGPAAVEHFKQHLLSNGIPFSKGAIQFLWEKEIPLDFIVELAFYSYEQNTK